MTIRRLAVAATLLLAAIAAPAAAQDYPTKPVRVLIGFAPGGPADLIGRVLVDHLSRAMGQPFIIESKSGAAGVVAGQALAAAVPDGHTLNLVSFAIIATARAMYESMTYDPATAFQPVTLLANSPLILEVAAHTPVKTYQEFIAYAKANSGKLNHGSPGVGTQAHLVGQLLQTRLGFTSQHIPYRGNGPLIQGMIQKEMDWTINVPSASLTLLKGGHIRQLAVSTDTRWPEFPDVPTLTELGAADSIWPNWFGLVAPAATPRPIVDRLAAEIAKGWQDAENVRRMRILGYEPWTTSPDETTRFFAAERERWTAVVKANNIKAE
ncbi:MAG: Bug family tripartite tricarboxylate transporter substrate binding protein [Rhodospirillales bacterium]